ncbi:hypothetical protein MASR1M48_16800 [Lactococcus petauri]
MKMKVLDLFSGIGGFSIGLENANMETVAFCEIDPHCREILKQHWPSVPIFEDIKKLKGTTNIPHITRDYRPLQGNIDVICGGFPCQDISIAGTKKGIKGERSGLWKEYKRLIGEVRPTFAIIENVANLRSKGLVTVLQDLWQLGYDAEWAVISAKSVGAWHERKRVWIIAFPHGYDFRLGVEASATKKEKQEWWSKARSALSFKWSDQPSICRTVNGVSAGLDERKRKRRIKQLGNSVLPQIPELIGKEVYKHWCVKNKIDPSQASLLE